VLEAIEEFFANAGGNTGRSGHRRSIAASRSVSLARERLADLLGAESPDNLIFTKNATEALNLAICGLVTDGARVVTTSLEHNSVMRPLREFERRGRCSIEVVRAESGACDLRFTGDAATLAANAGIETVAVSLAHEQDMAVAVVLATFRDGHASIDPLESVR